MAPSNDSAPALPQHLVCLTSHQNDFAVASFIKMGARRSSMQTEPLYYFLICLQKALAWCMPSLQIETNGPVVSKLWHL